MSILNDTSGSQSAPRAEVGRGYANAALDAGKEGGFFQSDNFGNLLQAAGMSLMSSPRNAPLAGVSDYLPALQQQSTKAAEKREAQEKKNQTIAWLQENDPEVASMVTAGLDVGDAYTLAFKRKELAQGPKPTSDMLNWEYAQKNPGFAAFANPTGGSAAGRLSTQPVWGRDADGNTVLGQVSNDGRFVQTELPEGVRPMSPGEVNEQKAYGTKSGTAGAEQFTAAPGKLQQAQDSISLIDSVINDPNLGSATGWEAKLPTVYSETRDVEAKVQQIGGQSFQQAIEGMRGLGAMSENEGKAATAAVARLQLDQSDEGFKASLRELRDYMERGRQKAEQILARRGGGNGQTVPPVSSPGLNDLSDAELEALANGG